VDTLPGKGPPSTSCRGLRRRGRQGVLRDLGRRDRDAGEGHPASEVADERLDILFHGHEHVAAGRIVVSYVEDLERPVALRDFNGEAVLEREARPTRRPGCRSGAGQAAGRPRQRSRPAPRSEHPGAELYATAGPGGARRQLLGPRGRASHGAT